MALTESHSQNNFINGAHQIKEYILVIAMVLSAIFYLSDYIEKVSASLTGESVHTSLTAEKVSTSPVEHNYQTEIVKWGLCLIIGVILYVLYFFTIRPVINKQRELRLKPTGEPDKHYFTTAPRTHDQYHFFENGYEQYLQLLRHAQTPLLYLTGMSGSGKSSLINAYLAPQLEKISRGRTKVLIVRSYDKPLEFLYNALGKQNPSSIATSQALINSLQKLSKSLPSDNCILIVLDQFEEFFLLRSEALQSIENEATESTEELKRFFHQFLASPPSNIHILLSYRDDFQQLIDQLELPARIEHFNFEQVNLLTFKQAKKFLSGCPGLHIPEEQLNRVLEEAASIDTPIAVRPIVLNLLGIILERMASQWSLPKQEKNLIRQYILDSLGKALRQERAKVLKEMLTDFNTARPRTISELSKATKLSVSQLDNQMMALQRCGLVRCLDRGEVIQAKRKWQVAHDFVALQLEKVVHGITRTFLQKAKPWLAPAMLCALLLLFSFRNNISVQKNTEFSLRIKSMLNKVPLNTYFKDVLVAEKDFDTVNRTLTSQIECGKDSIRYFWKYINPSLMWPEVYAFLYMNGRLDTTVSPSSYVMYSFKDDKLVRITLRMVSPNKAFDSLFTNALIDGTPFARRKSKYNIDTLDGIYYVSGASYKDRPYTEILMCNAAGYNSCIHDWWHH
jgi:hypothetical protein